MPKQVKKSGLAGRLAEVRDEIRYKAPEPPKGGGTLPAGVSGVAKLTRVDFDVMESGDYAGEQRFYSHGVCVSPKTFKDKDGNVHRTEGALVQLNKINLCDTTYQGEETPFADNWARAENRMKLLGIPTEDMDNETLEADVVEYAKENELFFRFRTWAPKDSDRVNVVLEGPATDFDPDEVGGDDVQDSTEDEDDTPVPKAKVEPTKPKIKQTKAAPEPEEEPPTKPKIKPNTSEDQGTMVFAKQADSGDKKAQIMLAQMAESRGIDTEPYETWTEVAQAILEQDQQEDSEDQNEVEPEKGDVMMFGEEEVLVTAVNSKGRKADVRGLMSKKVTKGVPWVELSPAE